MTTTLFDKWTDRYDCWFETQCGILVKQYESELLLKLLNPLSGEKILDVGCGTGVFTIDVMALGSRITGIDISEPMLRKAVNKIDKIDKFPDMFSRVFAQICVRCPLQIIVLIKFCP